jgi:hypothetical protein
MEIQGRFVALAGHCLILEDGPGISNQGDEQEEHWKGRRL